MASKGLAPNWLNLPAEKGASGLRKSKAEPSSSSLAPPFVRASSASHAPAKTTAARPAGGATQRRDSYGRGPGMQRSAPVETGFDRHFPSLHAQQQRAAGAGGPGPAAAGGNGRWTTAASQQQQQQQQLQQQQQHRGPRQGHAGAGGGGDPRRRNGVWTPSVPRGSNKHPVLVNEPLTRVNRGALSRPPVKAATLQTSQRAPRGGVGRAQPASGPSRRPLHVTKQPLAASSPSPSAASAKASKPVSKQPGKTKLEFLQSLAESPPAATNPPLGDSNEAAASMANKGRGESSATAANTAPAAPNNQIQDAAARTPPAGAATGSSREMGEKHGAYADEASETPGELRSPTRPMAIAGRRAQAGCGDGGGDMGMSQSLEAEERFLRRLGWNGSAEEEGEEEGLTEAEIHEFKKSKTAGGGLPGPLPPNDLMRSLSNWQPTNPLATVAAATLDDDSSDDETSTDEEDGDTNPPPFPPF